MAARLEYTSEHHQFRELVRDFVRQTVVPSHEIWERNGRWDRSLFIEAGKLGLLGFSVPERLGGPGVNDFRYNAIVIDELQRAGAAAEAIAFTLQNDIVLPYLTDLTTPEQTTTLAARCGDRRDGARHRHDRTRHRQRPGRDPHHGDA